MELATTVEPNSVRKRKCSSCGTDFTPKLEISIPGLNRLFDKSLGKPIKITWIIVVLICAVVCAGFTVHQLMEYFNFPVASKTFVERKDKVQFPSFSICEIDPTCYMTVIENEIKNLCAQNETLDCDMDNISLQELNISLDDVWNKCHFLSVSVNIDSSTVFAEPDVKDHVITLKHSIWGTCATVTHTEEIIYLSVMTNLRVNIESRTQTGVLAFIPHGEPDHNVNEFEIFNHEMEFIIIGFKTQLKIKEEVFKLKNSTRRPCYDLSSERQRMKQQGLDHLKNITCRLPFLPYQHTPECQTLSDVQMSIGEQMSIIFSLLNDGNWLLRRACQETVYAISVDYIIPNQFLLNSNSEAINNTVLTIKFADDTSEVISEYFSYTFPALVSDLFAYWGFFLCLSALVFVEIIEYFILKIYLWFTRRK